MELYAPQSRTETLPEGRRLVYCMYVSAHSVELVGKSGTLHVTRDWPAMLRWLQHFVADCDKYFVIPRF